MSAEAAPIARTINTSRHYGDVRAVNDISLDVEPGQLLGVLGPNGAGKTTLINLLVGLRRPSAGTVELCGGDPREKAHRRRIGVTPQESSLPEPWRVGELADFGAAHFPQPADTAELLERFSLADLRRRQIGGLSGGQQRRLAVALAFAGSPQVVFLDEPTVGLDVESRHAVWENIQAFHQRGGTVVLTSHQLEEIERLADRVVVIDRGGIVADGGVDEIRSLVDLKRVRFSCSQPPALPGVTSTEWNGDQVELYTNDAEALVHELVASGAAFTGLEIHRASLEDAFLAITAPASNISSLDHQEPAR